MASKERSVDFDYSVEHDVYDSGDDYCFRGIDVAQTRQDIKEGIVGTPLGRPPYIPNEKHYDIVKALCKYGVNHVNIAREIGISPKTLRKHYRDLLDNVQMDRNGAVEESLFYNAVVRKDFKSQAYWLDNHAKKTYNKQPIEQLDGDDDNEDDILSIIADRLPD